MADPFVPAGSPPPPSGSYPPPRADARAESAPLLTPYGRPMVPTPAPGLPIGLATAAVTLAIVWMVVQLGAFGLSGQAATAYERAEAQGRDLADVYTAYDAVNSLLLPVMVAAGVVGCLWLQQCRAVARVVAPEVGHRRGAAWVWLGWIVPVVLLWFPFQVVRDVLRGARVQAGSVLGWWWAAWLVALWGSNQASLASLGLGSRNPSLVPSFEALNTVATLASGVLWIVIVLRVRSSHLALRQG